jgi:large subunit ribosomal protein L9
MSTRIRVILLEDIAELGTAGDIINVSEGYARNALFPAGKAALADETTVSRAQHKKAAAQAEEERRLEALQQQADALDSTELTLTARVKNDDEEIFGRISAATVASELQKQAKLSVSAKDITLPKKITKVGSYPITVSFGSGIEATIHLNVIPDETKK